MNTLEELARTELRDQFLDDMIYIIDIERDIWQARIQNKPGEEIEAKLREEMGRLYREYDADLEGTPEASYLKRVMVYYKVPLSEEALQQKADEDFVDFCERHNLPTRACNGIMNSLYDSRRSGVYHLGELLVRTDADMKGKGLGILSQKQIKEALAEEGLWLGMLKTYVYGKEYTITSSQKTT